MHFAVTLHEFRKFCGNNSHENCISASSAVDKLVGKTLKLLVIISVSCSAHAGQFFVLHTLDFFVAVTSVAKRVIMDNARITAETYILRTTQFTVITD